MTSIQKPAGPMAEMTPSATLGITSKAKAMAASGEDVVSLCPGEPDFDTPEHIKAAAIEALEKGMTKYTPASGIPELKAAVAEKFRNDNRIDTDSANIVVGPGAKFSVFSAIAATCGPGDEVILAAPYWLSYSEMVKGVGATPVILHADASANYEINPGELDRAIGPKTRLLVLNTPSNPTGAVYRKQTLEKIAAIALKRGILVLADEIYEKLVYEKDFPHISIASLSTGIAENTITVNGLSKAYSMTGWRLGYLTAAEWIVKRITALQSHTTSNPTSFAQYGALAAIQGDQTPVENMRKAFSERRNLIFGLINGIEGISCILPQGAFYIFCDISSFGLGSWEFSEKLLAEEKVAVIPGEPFGAEGNIRLSYACSPEVIKESAERISRFCSNL